MASDRIWNKLRYFKRDSKVDRWGDPDFISETLLLKLDDFRNYLGVPVIVTRGVATSGHVSKSYHYPENGACAVDIMIPEYKGWHFDLIMDATRFGFTGMGWYPYWQYAGERVGGLHLDTRPLKWDKDETLNYKHSRWMGIPYGDGQRYIALTYENVLLHGGNDDRKD